ncbi:MAG: glycosyltransferase family 4 protein [Hyphomicrobiaceae bacterium]
MKLKVLLVGPNIDGTDVGEVYSAFKWVEALAEQADVTLLSSERHGRTPLAEQLPNAEVVTWPEPAIFSRFERLNAMAKPALPIFFSQVGSWVRKAKAQGRRFDIAHQIVPQAMRYATPLRHLDIPYVVGPLGGGLTTPEGFQREVSSGALVTRLRALDKFRLAHDPWLRAGYSEADLVLGVAPYVKDVLGDIPLKRFEPVLERCNDGLAPDVERASDIGRLKLLHVGRGVRTKGLRDVVRALALLADLPGVTLTSAGGGPEIDICRQEAEQLGIAEKISFLGAIPRHQVENLYAESDVFTFPSFREPMGGVLFEAMRWGLPVIAARRGGPDWIVDDTCGLKIDVSEPKTFARDIADAVRRLSGDPGLRAELSAGARQRVTSFGTWPDKASKMIDLYKEVLASGSAAADPPVVRKAG